MQKYVVIEFDFYSDMNFWLNYGEAELKKAETATRMNKRLAKNVIIFIGDGMSIPTLTAARIYKAQQVNGIWDHPEREYLTFERFDHLGHSKTFDVDYQVPDSASTASAMFSGVKTIYYTLGYDSSIDHYNSTSMVDAQEVVTILTWAQNAGKDTGLVSTARITHATPAATYAHTYDRNWECDSKYDEAEEGPQPEDKYDIAYQLVHNEPGKNAKVVMGGGRNAFLPLHQQTTKANWYWVRLLQWSPDLTNRLGSSQSFVKPGYSLNPNFFMK